MMRAVLLISALLLVISTSADARHRHHRHNTVSGLDQMVDGVQNAGDLAINRELRLGARGNDVWILQGALIALGYNPGSHDSFFWRRTRRALIAYQMANQLEPTGVVDHRTVLALRGQRTDEQYVVASDPIATQVWGPRTVATTHMISDRGLEQSTIRHWYSKREGKVINYNEYRAPAEVSPVSPDREAPSTIRVVSTAAIKAPPRYPRLRERFVPESDHTPKWNNPGALRPAGCVTWQGVVGLNSSDYVCFESNIWGAAAVIETIVRQYRSGRFRTPRQLFEHWTETVGDRDSYGATVGRKMGCGAHGDARLVENGAINKDRVIVMAMAICQFEHGERRGHLPREVFEEGFRLQFGF